MKSASLSGRIEAIIWLLTGGLSALLLTRLALSRALLLIGGVGLLLLVLIWPLILWPILAFAVPFGPTLPLGSFAVGSADVLIGLLVASWLLYGLVHRRIPWYPVPLAWPLLLYLAALLASLNNALSLQAALPELTKWIEVLALYVALSALLGDGHAFPRLRLFTGRMNLISLFLVLAASAEALVGLAQFFLRLGPPGFIILGRFLRAYGTFAQPNPYAGFLGLTFPLAISLTLDSLSSLPSALQRGRDTNTADLIGLLFYPLAAVLIGLGLLASWSRGGWLGMLAGTTVVVVLRSRRAAMMTGILLFLLVTAIVLGAIGAMPELVRERFQGVQDWTLFLRPVELRSIKVTGENFALVERMAHWWAAYAMWLDHPITGVGVGNYPVAYEMYRMPGWKEALGHAHNILLNVMAETGLVGLTTYILLWSWVFLYGLMQLRKRQGVHRALLVGALGGLTHLTIHNLFDNLYVHGMYAYVAVLLVLLSLEMPGRGVPPGEQFEYIQEGLTEAAYEPGN